MLIDVESNQPIYEFEDQGDAQQARDILEDSVGRQVAIVEEPFVAGS
jgi:hypothetical protein